MTHSFDVTVIGGGPGGVTAALEAARAGYQTALVEASRLGGTCLQVGCIPSKTFLHAAFLLDEMRSAKNFGVRADAVSFNLEALLQKKRSVVALLEKGIRAQLEKAKVTVISGKARFVSPKEVEAGPDRIQSRYFILATGSRPRPLAGFPFDGERIISSTEALEPKKIPASLLVIGGGVIGVEFASMYASFGSKVTVVEMLPRLIATEDPEISKRLEVSLKKRGIEIYLSRTLTSPDEIRAEQILVAVGRSRNTEDLGLDKAGVRVAQDGAVEVDPYLETTQPGIFAIGDLIRAPQLAHAASYEAQVAVRNLKEKRLSADLSLIPNAIYTCPEAASVGLTLEKAQAGGFPAAREVKMLFGALGRSHTEGCEEGIAKLVWEPGSGRILGAHLFGAHATEIISEITLAIKAKLTLQEIAQVVHPHPTFSEVFQELTKGGYQS